MCECMFGIVRYAVGVVQAQRRVDVQLDVGFEPVADPTR